MVDTKLWDWWEKGFKTFQGHLPISVSNLVCARDVPVSGGGSVREVNVCFSCFFVWCAA